ncbi:MAG: hypothetical protein JEZ06_03455 [Anaerolineaceae bacterium]|nr:hypothetical protein [Anaerolineaceae bacterium]
MLDHLRIKLTILYLFIAILFASLVSFSTYLMIFYYFQDNNDAALKYKMALIFQSVDSDLPAELLSAKQDWNTIHNSIIPVSPDEKFEIEEEEDDDHYTSSSAYLIEDYEGELSSIFVLPLDINGRLLFNPNPYQPPMPPNLEAVSTATKTGYDLRTTTLSDGSKVRLLTWKSPPSSGYGLFQLGKPIADQVRVLNQLISGLILVGAISIILLGVGSWWMAGRSLKDTQKAWERQQTFVANASHELRTPLTLVRASAEVAIRKNELENPQNKLLEDIVDEVDHMTKLVEELLLLSRLDAKQLNFENQVIDLQLMVEDIQRTFSNLAGSHQVDLIVNKIEGKVIADKTHLRQVILIILDNSLRHTDAGKKIILESRIEGHMVRFEIRDTGIGVDSKHLEHIFDRFYQVDHSRGGENKGSGLGLSIAKSLIEAQKGQIIIESQTGKGTTVSLLLPTVGK